MKADVIKRLDRVLVEVGLNNTKFANAVDISCATLSKYRNGQRDVSIKSANKIQKKYGYRADWLLSGKGSRKKRLSEANITQQTIFSLAISTDGRSFNPYDRG